MQLDFDLLLVYILFLTHALPHMRLLAGVLGPVSQGLVLVCAGAGGADGLAILAADLVQAMGAAR